MARTINPARVDFVTLRLFCAVAQSGSITKGAEACHLALSAASRRLSDFENAAGSKLLERSAQGIALTPAGHVAVQHAMRLFQGFEQFSSELGDYASGVRGHVRLWANMSALTEFLPMALATFLERHPDIRVEVEEQLSGDIVRALVDGLADVGVFAENTPAYGLEVMPFQTDELVVLCARQHPLARAKRVSFKTCLAYEFVGLNRSSSLLELTSRAAEQAGIPMRLRVQVRSFDAMCHMIAAGLGIGVVPLAACSAQVSVLGLKVLQLSDAWAERRLLMAAQAGGQLSPAAGLLLQHLAASSPSPGHPQRDR
ncbi:LysR family transcriptional regulator [Variovorax sp. JS1663]|uniref:LysR family transcriptional regulator n=1 Tax=Variovorax sp. JS1663 TaxID=1851577 RepID=UPI000B34730E|nr:LysR family transcriptional regulator [Variovorax sp. JS1663]OUM03940.1 LysR family transcriptional regulator [Variovorax sp. JS1663]